MLRIRFHGRGGQGMKTASRILGSAAFQAGYVVQDSPVYGAERRGAPMAAFTRMARAYSGTRCHYQARSRSGGGRHPAHRPGGTAAGRMR